MNIIKLMNAATQGKPHRLYPMLGWTLLEYTFRSTPYCIMLGVVWELFKLLQYPGTELNVKLICVHTYKSLCEINSFLIFVILT